MIEYREFGTEELGRVREIYLREGWMAYLTNDEALERAFSHSLYCLGAYSCGRLIGFVRCVGDGEHIVMVQDLIVAPEFQRQKIGTTLFTKVWERFGHVRMFQVVTDLEDEADNRFYQSFGMKPIREGHMIAYYRERAMK